MGEKEPKIWLGLGEGTKRSDGRKGLSYCANILTIVMSGGGVYVVKVGVGGGAFGGR